MRFLLEIPLLGGDEANSADGHDAGDNSDSSVTGLSDLANLLVGNFLYSLGILSVHAALSVLGTLAALVGVDDDGAGSFALIISRL